MFDFITSVTNKAADFFDVNRATETTRELIRVVKSAPYHREVQASTADTAEAALVGLAILVVAMIILNKVGKPVNNKRK